MAKYKIIQLNENTHSLLQLYAKENGYSIKGLVHNLITEKIRNKVPINVLRVKKS